MFTATTARPLTSSRRLNDTNIVADRNLRDNRWPTRFRFHGNDPLRSRVIAPYYMKAFFLLLVPILACAATAEDLKSEAPPTVPTSQLLPPEIVLDGSDYSINPVTATDGFMGDFHLHTRFGDYDCCGREMLFVRLEEFGAQERIDKVSKTGAFEQAITQGAVDEPVEAAVKIVKNPVGSLAEAPVGAARLVGKVLGGFASFGATVGKAAGIGPKDQVGPKPPPSRDDPIGYNVARSEWARKFGVDPYTTNRPLALKLNHLGMITFSMDKVAGAVSGAAESGLGPIEEWLSYLPDADEHLLTEPPKDVSKYNQKRLTDLGVSKQTIAMFLDNGWFSPPLQTRFVNAIAGMKDTANPETAVKLSANVESEEQGRFICKSLELLEKNLDMAPPPRQFQSYCGVAAATGRDGTLVVGLPADLLSWTEEVRSFASHRNPPGGKAILCLNGPATTTARDGFKSLGWQIKGELGPG